MNTDRIEKIQLGTAYSGSRSVANALLQVWNEAEQDVKSRFCSKCYHNNSCEMQYVLRQGVTNPSFLVDFGCNKWVQKDN